MTAIDFTAKREIPYTLVNSGGVKINLQEQKEPRQENEGYVCLDLEKPMLLDLTGLMQKFGPWSKEVYFFVKNIRSPELYQLARYAVDVYKNKTNEPQLDLVE